MSYNNYGDGAQPQQGQEEGGYGAPGGQQMGQMGQMGQSMDPSQQQSPFQGAQGGGPGPSPGGDQKTTLWYAFHLVSQTGD